MSSHRFSAASFVTPWAFLGRATRSSVIHAVGSGAAATSEAPNALGVLVNTQRSTQVRTASSNTVSVPVTFASTNPGRDDFRGCAESQLRTGVI